MISAFGHLYSGEVADVVRQAKIMGPAYFGSLTDQAVLYLEGADINNAQRVIDFLAQRIPEQAWVEHTPLGMVSLAKGRNYSESSRFAFLATVVQDRLLRPMRFLKTYLAVRA